MTLSDFWNDWKKIVDKRFAFGYNKLTANERIWYNTQALIQSIKNNGVFGFYYNSNVSIQDTLVDINALNSTNVALIIEEFNKVFPDSNPPGDTDERNKILDSLNKKMLDNIIERINIQLADNLSDLEMKLTEFIVKNKMA
jgi:hypothetical protein